VLNSLKVKESLVKANPHYGGWHALLARYIGRYTILPLPLLYGIYGMVYGNKGGRRVGNRTLMKGGGGAPLTGVFAKNVVDSCAKASK